MTSDTLILLLVIVFSIYFLMFCHTSNAINEYLETKETTIFDFDEGNIAVKNNINRELTVKDRYILSWTIALFWPIYYLFAMGASFGCAIYDILLKDDDENRLATWFF